MPETSLTLADVQAAVQAAVAKNREEMLLEFQSLMSKAPMVAASGTPDVMELFSRMALSFAEISDQGSNRKRVAPEILAARESAKERMGVLIMEARARDAASPKSPDRPRYRILAKCYLKERVIEPYRQNSSRQTVPNEIYWLNAPNTAMRPVNKAAKEIFAEFMAWLGGGKETTNAFGLNPQPVWITQKGAVLVGSTATAQAHGLALTPGRDDAFDLDDYDDAPVAHTGNGATEDMELDIVDAADPRAPEINVLGTVAPPAKRTVPGERARN
jgi:hypothetical protein